jgi:hypothetical protein
VVGCEARRSSVMASCSVPKKNKTQRSTRVNGKWRATTLLRWESSFFSYLAHVLG